MTSIYCDLPTMRMERKRQDMIRRVELFRECFAHKLKHCQDDAEAMIDYARDLRRAGADARPELCEAETFLKSLLLAVQLLQGEFQQAAE